MDSAKSILGWSAFMGVMSAGATYFGTGGDMTWVWIAFVVSVILTALVGPSLVTFFGEW